MVGAKIKGIFVDAAKKRQIENLKKGNELPLRSFELNGVDKGESREKAAALVNSSATSVSRAARVIKGKVYNSILYYK